MSRVVAYAEDLFDDHRDACTGPDVPAKAIGFGPPGQQMRDLCPLSGRQPRLRTRGNATAQRFDTSSFPGALEPLAHRPAGHSKRLGNLGLLPALLLQFPSSEPTAFPPVPRCIRCCSLHIQNDTRSRRSLQTYAEISRCFE